MAELVRERSREGEEGRLRGVVHGLGGLTADRVRRGDVHDRSAAGLGDYGALVRERPSDRTTDPSRRAGHEHDAPVEAIAGHHGSSGEGIGSPRTPRSPISRNVSPTLATTARSSHGPTNARFVGASNTCARGSSATTSTLPPSDTFTIPSGRYRVT